jgi:hypothetical protein
VHVPQPLVHRELLLPADPQGLVQLPARGQDVGDLAQGERPGSDVLEPVGCWQLFLPKDPEGLVQLPALDEKIGEGEDANEPRLLVSGWAPLQRLVKQLIRLPAVAENPLRLALPPD